ncbi:hypothetical protein Mnod_1582 [Methylobacterium nodulans ORS 2060]|uniref:Uncharacterized protein n=1 Tax=Methylobacterium nodulans (strain LMG 21967 / CNCM I-2342 / ORS 2060) TaxID=460265 RepID=B8IPS3_METNO|nr:hypothetical protein Mnod_1582 [Methylobacterium nodulans ORS 2060]
MQIAPGARGVSVQAESKPMILIAPATLTGGCPECETHHLLAAPAPSAPHPGAYNLSFGSRISRPGGPEQVFDDAKTVRLFEVIDELNRSAVA